MYATAIGLLVNVENWVSSMQTKYAILNMAVAR